MPYAHETTIGTVWWNQSASDIERADNPDPPAGKGWRLVSSCVSEVRYSKQHIFWFWEREVPEPSDPDATF
jgi:hypothetical protein